MPSLQDAITNAKSQFKNQTTSVKNEVRNQASAALSTARADVKGIGPALTRQATSAVTQLSQGAISAAKNSVSNAASQLVKGNVSGALDALTSGPGQVLNSLSSFGINTGSTLGGSSGSGPAPGNSLAGALARSEPMLSFNWYCVLPDVTPIGGSPTSLPWYYVEEATVPFRNIGVKTVFFESRQKHFADTYSMDSLRLTFYADTAGKSLAYLQAWQGAILQATTVQNAPNGSGGFGRATDYKKTIPIYLVDVNKKQLVKIEYIECWPTNLDQFNLESGSSNRILANVQFSVGDVFITLYPIDNPTTASLANRIVRAGIQLAASLF